MRHRRVYPLICTALVLCLLAVAAAQEAETPPAAAAETNRPAPVKIVDLTPATRFRAGLSYEESVKQLGGEAKVLRTSQLEKVTYRWSDQRGSSFIGRFEDGELVQKTGFRLGTRTAKGDEPLLSKADHEALDLGDSLEAALRIKPEATRVSGSVSEVIVYRWTNSEGKTFDGRFEDGKLRQHSGRELAARVRAKREEQKAAAAKKAAEKASAKVEEGNPSPDTPAPAEGEADTAASREVAATETRETPVQEAVVEEPVAEEGLDEAASPLPEPEELPEQAAEQEEESEGTFAEEAPFTEVAQEVDAPEDDPQYAPEPRVLITGTSRRDRAEEDDTGRIRRVRLPEYRHSLRRGRYEIRVSNPTASQVSLGLRAEGQGRDATAGPNGTVSFFVDNGVYTLHFIYRDDPYTLHQGAPVALNGLEAHVVLGGGGYSVSVLDGRNSNRRR